MDIKEECRDVLMWERGAVYLMNYNKHPDQQRYENLEPGIKRLNFLVQIDGTEAGWYRCSKDYFQVGGFQIGDNFGMVCSREDILLTEQHFIEHGKYLGNKRAYNYS
jgi:hypothetical protein